MKLIYCFLFFLLSISSTCFAQSTWPKVVSSNHKTDIVTNPEQYPRFRGKSQKALYAYIKKKLRYPAKSKRLGVEGRVYVQVIVEKDGSLSKIVAYNSPSEECGQEAIRVVKSTSPWRHPGQVGGVAVRTRIIIVVAFELKSKR